MTIEKLNVLNIGQTAQLMSEIKPEFWDYEGALNQLNQGFGWVQTDDIRIKGWLLAKEYRKYSVLEIECLGYSDDGKFVVDENLTSLMRIAYEWAKKNHYRMLRFIIGSRGLSCHQKKLSDAGEVLKNIHSIDRDEFDWLLSLGFKPMGILPNTYGDGIHGIMLIMTL